MTFRKAILAVCMVGLLAVAALSVIGQDVYLPGSLLGELTGGKGWSLSGHTIGGLPHDGVFILRHLRNKRPRSSIAPVQVFVNSVCWSACFACHFRPSIGLIG